MTGNLGQFEADWWRPVSESSLLLTEERAGLRPKARHESGTGVRTPEHGTGKRARASLEE